MNYPCDFFTSEVRAAKIEPHVEDHFCLRTDLVETNNIKIIFYLGNPWMPLHWKYRESPTVLYI